MTKFRVVLTMLFLAFGAGCSYGAANEKLVPAEDWANLGKYEEAKTDAEEVLPTKFIVNEAYKAERKSYPIRWLIVLVTAISAFLLTLVLILMLENIQQYLPLSKNLLEALKTKSYFNNKT